ncbi:hypothetical protein QYM36_014609 [Artemia franciscana]|uniref:RNA-directed DNA polymerase n=1 Tax=Artemia franciscana TaxID=6661 RepID=A0AA88HNW8_ARTSF|nr:hypothetical protein QYM36_014609 [Artemia franciscana]
MAVATPLSLSEILKIAEQVPIFDGSSDVVLVLEGIARLGQLDERINDGVQVKIAFMRTLGAVSSVLSVIKPTTMVMVCKLLKEKFGHNSSQSKLIHQDLILCEGEDPYPFIEAIKLKVLQLLSLSEVPDSTDASGSIIYDSLLKNTLLSSLTSDLGMKVMSRMPKSANEIETILVNEFTIREYGRLRLQKLNVTENSQATKVQKQVPSSDESRNSAEFSNLDSELNIHEQIVSPMEDLIPIIIESRSSRDIKIPKMVIGSAEMVNPNSPSLKSFINIVFTTESNFKDRTKPLRKEEVKEFLDRFQLDHLHGKRRIQLEKLLIENHDVLAKSAFDLGSYSEDPFHIEVENSDPVRIRPYPIPFHLHKKDGKHRLVTDYRELNKVIKKDSFPLPLISEILDSLGCCSVFSNLDSMCGYWQVLVDEDSLDVTAFSAPGFETYRYKKIPQGICSAPAHLSRVANRLMAPLASENVKIYLDDTLVASKTDRDHLATLKKVLNVCRKANIRLKPQKCEFLKSNIIFLGHKMSQNGIQPDPEAFEQLRAKLIKEPILGLPDLSPDSEAFQVYTDASDFACGAFLTKIQNGSEKVLQYISRSFNDAEKKHSVTHKECLAVMFAVRSLRQYLLGKSFVIVSDHKPLQYLLQKTDHTGKWSRFQLELLGYDFSVKYIKAEKNRVAEALSRLPVNPYPENLATEFAFAVGTDGNNHDMQAGYQAPNSSHVITRSGKSTDHPVQIYESHNEGKLSGKSVGPKGEIITSSKPSNFIGNQISRDNEDIFHGGHFGFLKTYIHIHERFYFRNMHAIIKKYVQSCLVCCQRKGLNYTPKSPLGSLPEVSQPLEMVGIDLLGPLPESVNARNKWILVISDAFSKHVTLVALPNKTANCVAKAFVEKFMLIYGPCENSVSDQGKEFCSDILNSIAEILKIKKMRTASFRPQCNGMTERQSAKLKQKENYDRDAKDIRLNVGDLVLLHVPRVARHNKLDRIRWLGPYLVIRLMGNGINFEIRRVTDGKTEIIHPYRLKPHVASQPWDHLTTKQFDGIKTDKPRKEVTWADDQGYNLTSSITNISTTPILTNSITAPLLDSPNPSIQTPVLPVIDFLPPSDRRITFTETIDNGNSIGTPDTSSQPLTPLPRTPRFPIPDNLHDGNYSDQPVPFVWTPPHQRPISLPPRFESQDSSLTPGILKQSISIGSEERLMWDDYLGPEYPDSSPLTDSHALEPKQLFVPVKFSSPMAKAEVE